MAYWSEPGTDSSAIALLQRQAETLHAVVFDIDGTLLQSAAIDEALYRDAIRSVLGPVQFRQSLEEFDFVTDSGILLQVLDDNSIPIEPEITAAVKAHFVTSLESFIDKHGPLQEVPGAREILRELGESARHAVGLATGGWRESAVLKLETAGFDITGLPLATSDDSIERTKIMRIALSNLGSDFRTVTYYGDATWDRDACSALGWQFVAVGPTLGGIESYDTADFA